MEMAIMEFINSATHNMILQLVCLAVVFDSFFGCLRAIRERKFNSCVGIDGAIRKIGMLTSLVFLLAVDVLVNVNLIGFIPEDVRIMINLKKIGTAEFFGLLYLAYETVSISKNMALSGLPVRKVWKTIRTALNKYTDELPDADGLDKEERPEQEKKE